MHAKKKEWFLSFLSFSVQSEKIGEKNTRERRTVKKNVRSNYFAH